MAIYYISNTGSDSNSGTSSITPWNSIDRVNSFSFLTGDQVLFKRGNTFRGVLMPKTSGSSGVGKTGIYCMGDSITAGMNTAGYPDLLQVQLGGNYNVYNKGVGGNLTADMLARFATDITNNSDVNYVMIMGGTNNCWNTTASVATSELQQMYNLAHAKGAIVIALTVPPIGAANWESQANRDVCTAINQWIKTSATNVDYVIDIYTGMDDPTNPGSLRTIDTIDGIHFTAAGYTRMMGIINSSVVFSPIVTSAGNIVYGAYDSGAKPKILNSLDKSLTSDWTNFSGNLWRTTVLNSTWGDCGNLIFNNEAVLGVKKQTLGECTTQGTFYMNSSEDRVYLYSTSNPGTYYSHIELGGTLFQECIDINGKGYLTIEDLDVRYAGNNGIITRSGTNNIIIQRCDVSFCGGMYWGTGGTRMGNGIQMWENNSNITIRYNYIHDVYDAGISPQGEAACTYTNIQIYNNIIVNFYYGFEFWLRSNQTANGIYLYNNTFYGAGRTWSYNIRPSTGTSCHYKIWSLATVPTNFISRNNIFKDAVNVAIYFGTGRSYLQSDYNLYDVSNMAESDEGNYTTLSGWVNATGKDTHSIAINPLFISAIVPYDLHLQSGSPAINAGINVGLPYYGSAPDIGAYETNSGVVVIPTLTTTTVTSITTTTASSGGNITSDGGGAVTARGVCWSTTVNPTIANSKTIDGIGIDSFVSSITGLTQATIYHVRAYATNSVGTAYGNDVQFVTGTPVVIPTVTTQAVTGILYDLAYGNATVTSNGGATTTSGFCWATHTTPTLSDNFNTAVIGSAQYSGGMQFLTPSTLYYVRAYSTNSAGTAYGNQVTFTTLTPAVPSVSTGALTLVTQTSASIAGSVTNINGSTVTATGICWSITTGPTTANSLTSNGTALNWTGNLTGLSSNTLYYARAYATNGVGTTYGTQISFTTGATIPTLLLTTVTNITQTTATSGGNTLTDGGSAITTKGVCWNTTGTPTIADSKTTDGTSTSNFTSTLSGLSAGTLYYVRAYATNSIGTGYSTQSTFTTSATQTFCEIVKAQVKKWLCIPVAGYGALYNWYAVNYNINGTSIAPTGWHVPTLNDWNVLRVYLGWTGCGDHLKETGTVRWPEPNSTATNDTGFTGRPGGYRRIDGIFADIGLNGYFWHADLNIGNTYGYMNLISISDFLGNGWGITYANHGVNIRCVKDTTTLSNGQTSQFIDVDGNTVFTVCIGTQEWMASNLKVTRYNDGTSIPLITNDKSWGEDVDGAMCYYNNDINNV
jgi:uncharacterized protein (TIGR02145 family)